MKTIKTILFSTLFLFGFCIYGQSNPKNTILKKNKFKTFTVDLDLTIHKFNFKKVNLSKNNPFLSTYNRNTKLNDIYVLRNNQYVYSQSKLAFENNFRGNKIDSFNPYGTSDIRSALLVGVINLLLK